MLRVGAEIGKDAMPPLSALEARDAGMLDERKGWVGETDVEGREGAVVVRELGLGAQGRVRDEVFYRMVRERKG